MRRASHRQRCRGLAGRRAARSARSAQRDRSSKIHSIHRELHRACRRSGRTAHCCRESDRFTVGRGVQGGGHCRRCGGGNYRRIRYAHHQLFEAARIIGIVSSARSQAIGALGHHHIHICAIGCYAVYGFTPDAQKDGIDQSAGSEVCYECRSVCARGRAARIGGDKRRAFRRAEYREIFGVGNA